MINIKNLERAYEDMRLPADMRTPYSVLGYYYYKQPTRSELWDKDCIFIGYLDSTLPMSEFCTPTGASKVLKHVMNAIKDSHASIIRGHDLDDDQTEALDGDYPAPSSVCYFDKQHNHSEGNCRNATLTILNIADYVGQSQQRIARITYTLRLRDADYAWCACQLVQ